MGDEVKRCIVCDCLLEEVNDMRFCLICNDGPYCEDCFESHEHDPIEDPTVPEDE